MQTRKILTLLSVFALVACGQNAGPKDRDNKVVCQGFGTFRLEAEKFDVKNWSADPSYGGFDVIEEEAASGGAYLAAADPDSSASAVFYFELTEHSYVTFSAAYAQTEDWLDSALEMDKTYEFNVESVSNFTLGENKTLKARSSATSWELMTYQKEDLYAGEYKVTLRVLDNVPKGCPSIDYVQFKTTDASYVPVDPSTVTAVPGFKLLAR